MLFGLSLKSVLYIRRKFIQALLGDNDEGTFFSIIISEKIINSSLAGTDLLYIK